MKLNFIFEAVLLRMIVMNTFNHNSVQHTLLLKQLGKFKKKIGTKDLL